MSQPARLNEINPAFADLSATGFVVLPSDNTVLNAVPANDSQPNARPRLLMRRAARWNRRLSR